MLRGFLTTSSLVLFALFSGYTRAQTTARFADAPTPNASATATPTATAVPPASEPSAAHGAPARVGSAPLFAPDSSITEPTTAAPQAGFTRRLAQSHFERAAAYESRGDIAQALREYSETISIDSTLGQAYLRLGALRERMGEPREADLVYSVAVQLTDTRSKALIQRSHLRRAAGLNAQALNDLESAAELEPSRAVLEELARDYVELHSWAAALAIFRRIAALANTSADTSTIETARLEARALRVLAAETDSTQEPAPKHDWVSRALRSIARR